MNAISRRGVLGFALAVSAGWLAQAEARDAPTARAAIAALLAARIDLQHRGTGGLIAAVNAHGGWTASHGVVARGAARRVSLDTPFQIASLTKIFTALLLSDAVRRGDVLQLRRRRDNDRFLLHREIRAGFKPEEPIDGGRFLRTIK